MSKQRITPSQIARHVAGATWGNPVQDQQQLTKGIYLFSTPGHGGAVAVLGVADLPADHVAAAQSTNRTELVAVAEPPAGYRARRRIYSTSQGYTRDSIRELGQDPRFTLYEVWVGEEDCEINTILFASPAAREGMSKRMINPAEWMAEHGTDEALRETMARWSDSYLAALENTTPEPAV